MAWLGSLIDDIQFFYLFWDGCVLTTHFLDWLCRAPPHTSSRLTRLSQM